jgi:hypothetical protein
MSLIGQRTSSVTIAQLRRRGGHEYWSRQRVIDSGHTDNLVFDDGHHRVWVSRMTLDDYDGDRRAYLADRITFERRTPAGWKRA